MKLCTVCGVVTSRAGSRCTEHARQSNRSRHNALYSTRAWQRLSARVLRAWRGEHGNWCPGYQRRAHSAIDLTVDHVVPLAAGGAPLDITNCAVLCRSCNSTKGGETASPASSMNSTKGSSEGDRGSPHADPAALKDRALPLYAHGRVSRKIPVGVWPPTAWAGRLGSGEAPARVPPQTALGRVHAETAPRRSR